LRKVFEQLVNTRAGGNNFQFSIFYDGISIQHLATLLVSVFKLCYGLGLPFRGPYYISLLVFLCNEVQIKVNKHFFPLSKGKKICFHM
jgi:hypothetical protein